jgi:type II secretory pathway pseudopilin PulG
MFSFTHASHAIRIPARLARRGGKTGLRGGFTVTECLVAAAMLAAVMALAAQLFIWDAQQRREAWKRQVAQQEAANVLERLSSLPIESLAADQLEALELSPEARTWLPDGTLAVSATEITAPRPGKRILVEVQWGTPNGAAHAPVRLIGWAFAPGATP